MAHRNLVCGAADVPQGALGQGVTIATGPISASGHAALPPAMRPSWGRFQLTGLVRLMDRTVGRSDVVIGLVDGPVDTTHHDLLHGRLRELPSSIPAACFDAEDPACSHGTFVAGVLSASRDGIAPGICPGCTLLIQPVFAKTGGHRGRGPAASAEELAQAIVQVIEAGARIVNLSLAVSAASVKGVRELNLALTHAVKRGAIVVAAAGNQGAVGDSALLGLSWVVPVIACDAQGRPLAMTNLGNATGRRGLAAPGLDVPGLRAGGGHVISGGTSAAAPFVTGAVGLLWSLLPEATAGNLRFAITAASSRQRQSVVPPVLDAWNAYGLLAAM